MSRPEALRERTKQFALQIVRLFRSLPRTEEARVIGKQLLRSGTSVAANYRAVCRARSKAELVAKIGSSLKRPTKRSSGSNCSSTATSLLPLDSMACSARPTNC
jgi:hypothetical protein